jgi:streptogramin lyase
MHSQAANPSLGVVQYPLPASNSLPSSITTGPDGNMWFTEQNGIGRISLEGILTEFAVSGASNIVAGPDGNLWFTEPSAIGQITAAGQITEFPLPNIGFSPTDITGNLDGNLWFCFGTNIGRITPAGSITLFKLPTFPTINGDPRPIFFTAQRIVAGADGRLWFSDQTLSAPWSGTTRQDPMLGVITTNGFQSNDDIFTEDQFESADRVFDLTFGPDGNVWFVQNSSSGFDSPYQIFNVSPSGVFAPSNPNNYPGYPSYPQPHIGVANRLTAGPDGNVWFTQPGQVVGRITPNGDVTIFNTTNVNANALAAGPDGNLWFTDSANNQVGKFILPSTVPPTFAVPPDVVVNTDPGQCSASQVSLGTPTSSNSPMCSVARIINDAPVAFSKGTTVVTWTLNDTCGGTQTGHQNVTVVDSEAPVIICPTNITLACSGDPFVPVTFLVRAIDNCDPAPLVTTSIASGSGFPAGTTTVNCTAQDASGNQSTCSFTVTRDPGTFDGFGPPIGGADATGGSFDAPVQTFKMGSVMPVRFSLDCGGSAVTSGVHTLQAIKWTDQTNSTPPIDATPPGPPDSGNVFKLTGNQWFLNVSTKDSGMSPGQWQLIATLSDGSQHSVWVQLK